MTKKVGILGVMAMAMAALLHPTVASAQDRDDYRRGYAPYGYQAREWRGDDRGRDRDFRRDHEWREERERENFRAREWREHERFEHQRFDHGYYAPYYGWR